MPETAVNEPTIREAFASILKGAQRPVFVKDECSRIGQLRHRRTLTTFLQVFSRFEVDATTALSADG